MHTEKEFLRIMNSQHDMALATSVDGVANVRIVNFYYDETSKKIFFSTFKDNNKVKEFEQNNNIAITTIPHMGTEHVKLKGKVQKSELTIYDLKNEFVNKIEDYRETIEQMGQYLALYEIVFEKAVVILDFEDKGNYCV
ncbi:pyridoxamine 5'-phosphate oxidase family protein [Vallitalea pronyensis]|uniref:Pyridoxamine 5'-phosphate oxidase family protein n=1 Tax=Vallitalea pronyensis TaxID=1348613 RepID=A0A8J8MP55_9FIRM|nr:pyridoxamine 5'-phosphate oxidase family protein [Vallitalea pronyensis]QUI25350.1 pyridoxamine 5'-phosphate oxidase family protein [Vallitalea pronyensis]